MRESLDWFFCGFLCREGEKAVKDFVNERYKNENRTMERLS